MTDLSKAFDCIPHEILMAKLNTQGPDETSLIMIISYLKSRAQTNKVGSLFSELLNIIYGVSQGSIIGPLLSIIYICDLFIVNKGVTFSSYADNTTPFITGMSFEQIILELDSISTDFSQRSMNNNLKANAGKFDLFLSPYADQTITVKNYVIKSKGFEELLGVKTESSNFEEYILSLFKKTNHKLHPLSHVCKYMTMNKGRILMKSFIVTQFDYCRLIRMIRNRGLNNKINHMQERILRKVRDDYSSSFEDLLNKDKSVLFINVTFNN